MPRHSVSCSSSPLQPPVLHPLLKAQSTHTLRNPGYSHGFVMAWSSRSVYVRPGDSSTDRLTGASNSVAKPAPVCISLLAALSTFPFPVVSTTSPLSG